MYHVRLTELMSLHETRWRQECPPFDVFCFTIWIAARCFPSRRIYSDLEHISYCYGINRLIGEITAKEEPFAQPVGVNIWKQTPKPPGSSGCQCVIS